MIKFSNRKSSFSTALKTKVNNYFIINNIQSCGNWWLVLKATVLLASLILLYFSLLILQPHWLYSLLICILLGINFATIGFNIMHDAGHNSFSANRRVNTILSYSLNLLGGNIYLWKLKHNIAHHTFTNIEGEDHDIEIKFMRVHHDQTVKKHHRFQHLYFIFLYSLSYLGWIFYQDYEKYFRGTLGSNSAKISFPIKEKFIFWISKLIHLVIFVLIPIIIIGFVPTLIGILVVGLVCGICLATVFQLAHAVSTTEFKTVVKNKIEDEWMIHQLQSTSNFATKSKFLTWLLGGLNFQVEHHLFPKISHVHYSELNKIIKETCSEFRIKYNEFPTIFSAFNSHVKLIKSLGK